MQPAAAFYTKPAQELIRNFVARWCGGSLLARLWLTSGFVLWFLIYFGSLFIGIWTWPSPHHRRVRPTSAAEQGTSKPHPQVQSQVHYSLSLDFPLRWIWRGVARAWTTRMTSYVVQTLAAPLHPGKNVQRLVEHSFLFLAIAEMASWFLHAWVLGKIDSTHPSYFHGRRIWSSRICHWERPFYGSGLELCFPFST